MAPRHDVLDRPALLVVRVALVAHLRDDRLLLGRLLLQVPRFVDRPAERLLDVDVLAGIHRVRGDDGVHVIRRGDDDRVEVLLLLEHLAVVAVLLQARNLFVDEAPQVGGVVLRRPLRVGGQLRLRRPPARETGCGLAARRRPFSPRAGLRLARPLRQLPVEQAEIAVADRDDVLAHHAARVLRPHAVDADDGDVDEVARRLEAAPEHVPGHDHKPGAGARHGRDKLPARDAGQLWYPRDRVRS